MDHVNKGCVCITWKHGGESFGPLWGAIVTSQTPLPLIIQKEKNTSIWKCKYLWQGPLAAAHPAAY